MSDPRPRIWSTTQDAQPRRARGGSRCAARTAAVALLALAAAATASAQDKPAEPRAASETLPLRAVVLPTQSIFDPNGAIWLHFALCNESDQSVDVPLPASVDPAAGVGLPADLIVGTRTQPALAVGYQNEAPSPLRPTTTPAEGAPGMLRVAPHGSVGALIDLRTIYPAARYSGVFRIEWRPLEGRTSPGTCEFRVEARKEAIFVTDYGKVTFTLAYEKAPLNVENFLDLCRTGFYDNKTLHRIIPGFLAQGGCPNANGTGMRPDGRSVPAEFHDAPFDFGVLAMAHKKDDPNSASCQFFIALGRAPELDAKYTVIGSARDDESQRTLRLIAAQPTDRSGRPIRSVIIRSINLVDADTKPAAALGPSAAP